MKSRLLRIGIAGLVLVSALAACGESSTTVPNSGNNQATHEGTPSANVQATDKAGRDNTDADAAKERVANEVYPTSTLYAEDQPSPTPLAGAVCSYLNPNTLVFQGFEEKRAELHACIEEFSWPDGYEIDPETTAFDGGSNFGAEKGGARTIVVFNNACAWTNYWLDSTKAGDQQAADRAVQYMVNVLPFLLSPGLPDPENAESYFLNMARRAELGDSGPVVQFIKSDCRPYDKYRVRP